MERAARLAAQSRWLAHVTRHTLLACRSTLSAALSARVLMRLQQKIAG